VATQHGGICRRERRRPLLHTPSPAADQNLTWSRAGGRRRRCQIVSDARDISPSPATGRISLSRVKLGVSSWNFKVEQPEIFMSCVGRDEGGMACLWKRRHQRFVSFKKKDYKGDSGTNCYGGFASCIRVVANKILTSNRHQLLLVYLFS
jgi:hypothetical protein